MWSLPYPCVRGLKDTNMDVRGFSLVTEKGKPPQLSLDVEVPNTLNPAMKVREKRTIELKNNP